MKTAQLELPFSDPLASEELVRNLGQEEELRRRINLVHIFYFSKSVNKDIRPTILTKK
jgi:hypothetical protein